MDWQHKLAALNAICRHAVLMRAPGDWYISANMEIAGDGMLTGLFGNGTSPEEAVNDHWRQFVTDLPSDRYIYGGEPGNTKAVRWNGFMWADASHMRQRHAAKVEG